jgi:bifunctional DNA-binding transcriptional regulator/antitoxin component of YhaV-PrlF toxin-antitoxin module
VAGVKIAVFFHFCGGYGYDNFVSHFLELFLRVDNLPVKIQAGTDGDSIAHASMISRQIVHYLLNFVMGFDKVMSMDGILTITSKGQTTLPAAARRRFGLGSSGGKLRFRFDEISGKMTIEKAETIDELSERLSSLIKPGTKPLLNVDEYYQKNRTAEWK